MKKSRYAFFCLIATLTLSGHAYCKNDSAESHVEKFYKLYASCKTSLTINSDLSKYVDTCILNTIRILNQRDFYGSEYFNKFDDCIDDWKNVLTVHKEMRLTDTTSVVPITFTWTNGKQHHILVFVRKLTGGWRIMKVNGTEHFYE